MDTDATESAPTESAHTKSAATSTPAAGFDGDGGKDALVVPAAPARRFLSLGDLGDLGVHG